MRYIPPQQLHKSIRNTNPHWIQHVVDEFYRDMQPRRYFDLFLPLVQQTDVRRAVILMGPRRVGKTVMLWHTLQHLLGQGHRPSHLCYISLDTPLLHTIDLEELLEMYQELQGFETLDHTFVFFDEVQYLKDWDVQLKVLVDRFPKTKFVASGSAAGALQRQSQESGAGRFTDLLLPPLTFYEYLDLLGLNEAFFKIDTDEETGIYLRGDIGRLNHEFINYLNYGGFPEAMFTPTIREDPQRFLRGDIIDKVLLRDLPSIYGIHDTQELNRFFGAIVYHTGNEVSYEKLSQASGIAKNTIKRYIEYLEAAFLIKTIRRVDDSGKTFKRTNFFKVYLTNPSMYTAIYGSVTEEETEALGSLVETAVFSQILHDPERIHRIHYARWKGGQGEVDLVFLGPNFHILSATEIKWSDNPFHHPEQLKGVKHFCSKNPQISVGVTTKTQFGVKTIGGHEVRFQPTAGYCWLLGYLNLQNFREKRLLTLLKAP